MEEGRGRKRARTVGLILVAGLVGYLIGPPIVSAATNLVIIKDSGSSRKARVLTGGAVKVRPDGGSTTLAGGFVFTGAGGYEMFADGTGNQPTTCDLDAIISGIVVDGGASPGTVTVTADTDFDGADGDLVWQGTAPAGGHLNDTFDSGVYVWPDVDVTVTGTVGRWFLYGLCFGNASGLPERFQKAVPRAAR